MTRILVVDDDATSREIACAFLAAAGYAHVSVATSGEEALALLDDPAAPRIDAVLLDVLMEGIDGIEICARIRGNPRHADLPVLMLTAVAEADSLRQAFVAGATDYITKPARRVELTARLRSALRLKAELDRRRQREAALEAALRSGAPARPLADQVTGLPGAEMFEAVLAAAPQGAGVVALLLDGAAALGEVDRLDAARRAVVAAAATVQAPVGTFACDLGRGLFAVLVPPGHNAAALGAALRGAVARARIAVPAGSLSGRLGVSMGQSTVAGDARDAFTAAVAAAERMVAGGADDGAAA
jgi:CheY-like chemotaxis protein